MPLAAGTRLGPYEILLPLGAGGMGEVYKARDTRLDRLVAIKILPSADPELRQRFEREAKAVAALSHPNICLLHDVGHQHGIDFLVIEYLEGETLADRLKEGPLAHHVMCDLAVQIADALDTAHGAHVVHRDLKPHNVIITKRGQAKVLDFGLAKIGAAGGPGGSPDSSDAPTRLAATQLTSPGSTLGTVAYMSPEQARGEQTDARTDIFSFGAMLYEMATGRPAFPGRTPAIVFDEILNKAPVSSAVVNPEVAPEVDRVIVKALEKNRDARYQTAADLRRDLERARDSSRQPRENDGPQASRDVTRRRSIRLAALAAAAVLLVVLLIANRERLLPSAAVDSIDSIAVLPFVNASGTPDADYLSDGISGTLTNNLARVGGLRVIPRTLSARYRNDTTDPARAGRELNARAVVTGRVVQRGDRLIIQAELIDVASVSQLWGDQFERPLADVVSVQAEISRAIADNLRLRLTPDDRQNLTAGAPRDAMAYQLYLRGQYATNKRTRESYQQATQYFNQALARDPSYALAYAGLADAYIWQGYWGYLNSADAYQKAVVAARQATTLDDRSADGHAALAWISLYYQWDWGQSEREYQRAIALDPTNATIRRMYGESLGTRGRFDEAIAEIRRAVALDPMSGPNAVGLGFMLSNAGHFDESIAVLKRAIALEPDHTLARLDLARTYRLAGMTDLAIAESQRMLDSGDPLGPVFLAASYAVAGRKAQARELLETLVATAQSTQKGSFAVALVLARLGERDRAFEWLERAYQEHDTFLPWLRVDPDFVTLRHDPRFEELVRRIGIPER